MNEEKKNTCSNCEGYEFIFIKEKVCPVCNQSDLETRGLEAEEPFLLHLVDVVYGIVKEDESVPSTVWVKEMIAKAKETFKPII